MSAKLASPPKKLRQDDYDDPGPTNTSAPAHSPMSTLSDDILYYIFSINSVMEMIPFNKEMPMSLDLAYEDGALTTNRYSSQVCRRWRNIILSSPAIWANSLNIDELNQRGDEWRWEVLDRTGDAPLTLIGRINYMYSDEGNHVKDFIEEVLANDWDRMRYFSLCTNEMDIAEDMLYVMQAPGPMLEYFHYWTGFWDDAVEDEDEPPTILFDGHSPKLTFFCCDGVKFDFHQGALSNLRQLWFAGHRATFTIAELYHGLRHLPLLEELNIDHTELLDHSGLSDDTPILSLPRLADITIHMCGKALVSKLVKHISPARGCRLVVAGGIADRSDGSGIVDVQELSQVYATFIKEYADFEAIPYLSCTYHREQGFSLRAATGPKQFYSLDSPSQYPNIAFGYHSHERIAELLNLDLFSAPVLMALASRTDLGHITKLNLVLDEHVAIRSQQHVLALLTKLGSVVHLSTDLPTLRVLVDIQAALGLDAVIFPHLSTLVIEGEASKCHDLLVFLDGRSKSGNPVKFLDLPKVSYSNDGRWKFLDGIDGLSVVWSAPTYGIPGEHQFVELDGSLVPANTIRTT